MSEYSGHSDYMGPLVALASKRQAEVEAAFRAAFKGFIESRKTEVIIFSSMNVHDLARAIQSHPKILKALVASCNIAARAIERDLGIKSVDTYAPKLTAEQAAAIAGFLKPFLPDVLEIPALSTLDRVSYLDKEIRKGKGQWEKRIESSLTKHFAITFKKRKFFCEEDEFELDAATPASGPIEIGIDVKRIEARRDIHKRCDEIVNKASKLKAAHKRARFGAVIYYPFITEHINVQNRLRSPNIDAIVFASDDDMSIDNAVQHLLAQFRG